MEAVAIDCEFVETSQELNALAHVVVVNEKLQVLLNTYVKPQGLVHDYRTHISGVKPRHLENAPAKAIVSAMVEALFKMRLIVGHGLKNDLQSLSIAPNADRLRDTSFLPKFLQNGKSRKLKDLASDFLHLSIQQGSHDPLEDATAAMKLYKEFWDIPGAANPICHDNSRRTKKRRRSASVDYDVASDEDYVDYADDDPRGICDICDYDSDTGLCEY